ncbi:FMN-dependent NADH-azoreductase [Billgrantia tianxiuensis]|uniref:FMN dependent NADH:quinone oxidoreductase n=1 Tax=Billgrantia tianxiuensis TaxID=2497861 RepID=A0A6I6SKF9_9GAMM|nr:MULTISPECIES: NAD(P)H-dependent oxidoreductase [Halomonas]MCE8032214.1 FMN-dependent NADH-azoreductase [Halomonas sp. MCCC 1A11057]QHC49771.1 FMN-dependent NADH-azoreductase [Halomonas tianxiuensis]
MKLLHLDSGLFEKQSISRQLSARIVEHLQDSLSELEIVYRDLVATPPSHLSGEIMAGAGVSEQERNGLQHREAQVTEALLEEFLSADVIVIGAPMYNFTIPSQLKAWLDRILQAGRTFRYTENGPVGLAGGRQVIIASSRGGIYSQGPDAENDFQERYLRAVFSLIGIDDVTVIRAEGVAMGDEARESAVASAQAAIAQAVKPRQAA